MYFAPSKGIFANAHVPYEYAKREQNLDIPTLSDMTSRAIEVLQQGEEGFFLLVSKFIINLFLIKSRHQSVHCADLLHFE